ncbi:MAG TPA: zf-HC2 domain-containing protein [Terriglobia bacterium]|nr:zf-HC2 domain-containing protein [Terriglobia bacterium]
MKCHEREKLFSYLCQMVKPREAEEVRRHLAGCPRCAQVVEEYRKLDLALDKWTAAEPSPWFDARIRARLAASEKEKSGFLGFGGLRTLVVSVLSVVLIVAGFIAFHQRRAPEQPVSAAGSSLPVVSQTAPQVSGAAEGQAQSLSAEQRVKMDENLSVLEDYDMLANFDVLSELPKAKDN